jgi:hypothetical protein
MGAGFVLKLLLVTMYRVAYKNNPIENLFHFQLPTKIFRRRKNLHFHHIYVKKINQYKTLEFSNQDIERIVYVSGNFKDAGVSK